MTTLEERKAAHEREREAIAREEEARYWAQRECEKQGYGPTERRRLLAYLQDWVKTQPGHGVDCNCGECD